MKYCLSLEAGNGHLSDWWANRYVCYPMEFEASEVLRRLGDLGVSDFLGGLCIQEQGQHPWERNHPTILVDLHEDDLGTGGPATPSAREVSFKEK